MKIGEKTFVSISYTLKVNGETVETVTAERPLEFVYGTGNLLPKFEDSLKDLVPGDPFAFTLTPDDGYGERIPEAVVDLPKDVFMMDGVIEEGLLTVGNQLPMSDNQGNRMLGTITAVGDDTVTMDFNHPMAGNTLDFTGAVVAVREATAEDMMPMGGGCGCGCEGECDDDCGCGDSDCSCGK